MATYHKPYKGKRGVPVKKATGKNIGASKKARLPSLTMIENRKRANNQARMAAKKEQR